MKWFLVCCVIIFKVCNSCIILKRLWVFCREWKNFQVIQSIDRSPRLQYVRQKRHNLRDRLAIQILAVVVETPLGRIQGYHKQSYNGNTFSVFEGIPFAKPPIGPLRFKEPEPIEPWLGIWNASSTIKCLQSTMLNVSIIHGQEDCLYINVYVPREIPNPEEKLEVIVHIHGGGFLWNSGHKYAQPHYFMDHDVIFVTFNYRLGILGFLSTNDDVLPGNNGLKDQVLALKWVQQNIQSFGGNSDSVTLTGLSAGGASVHLHFLSTLSKGLFHRALSQSGVALNPWVLQEEPLQKARTVAANLGCPTDNNENMIECLRQRPANYIVLSRGLFYEYKFLPICPFGPVIEVGGKKPFLNNSPYNILFQGVINDVPWILSTVEHEGLFPGVYIKKDLDIINASWTKLAPHLLDYNYTVPSNFSHITSHKIKKHYFEEQDINKGTFLELVKMLTERLFVSDVSKAAKLHSKVSKSDVYYYHFSYPYENNLYKTVGHAEDGQYIFYNMYSWVLSETDLRMKDLLLEMLVSFAKTGKPEIKGVTWNPIRHSGDIQLTYLNISTTVPEHIKQETVADLGSEKFWTNLGLLENENLILHQD